MAALTFCVRLGELLVQHSGSNTEMVALLDHVIIVNMEHHVLPPLPLGSNLWGCTPIQLSTAHCPFEHRAIAGV